MAESERPDKPGGTAVWYFVGATFLFAGSTFLGTPAEDGGANPIGLIGGILGFVVLAAGLWVFARERKRK